MHWPWLQFVERRGRCFGANRLLDPRPPADCSGYRGAAAAPSPSFGGTGGGFTLLRYMPSTKAEPMFGPVESEWRRGHAPTNDGGSVGVCRSGNRSTDSLSMQCPSCSAPDRRARANRKGGEST